MNVSINFWMNAALIHALLLPLQKFLKMLTCLVVVENLPLAVLFAESYMHLKNI